MKLVILWVVILTTHNCFAQDYKRNNVWVLGFDPMVFFDCSSSTPIFNSVNGVLDESSCISDSTGNFQFCCAGFLLTNASGSFIDSSVFINSPQGNVLANQLGGIANSDQMSIIIPKQGNQYYVFSTGMSDSVANEWLLNNNYVGYDVLNYSIVDMDSNGGSGKVIDRNRVVLDNQRYYNCALTAVKHGNGYDWWLVKADAWKHQFQTFLVKSDTIEGPFYYSITDTTNSQFFYSQIYFSEDGTTLATNIQRTLIGTNDYSKFNRVDLFDFDRCSGQFAFRNFYEVPADSVNFPYVDANVGICFSPDSKLLYAINWYNIYQIDIEDTNRYNGILIHGPDDSLIAFPSYHIGKCAPNGKLYIGNFDGTRNSMSYIDSPNIRGLGCNFIPKGLIQNFNSNLKNPPNMPNYGLGGNGLCIPANLPVLSSKQHSLELYPNPTNNLVHIKYAEGKVKQLYNSVGQLLVTTTLNEIDVSRLDNGVYFLHCLGMVRKVVVE